MGNLRWINIIVWFFSGILNRNFIWKTWPVKNYYLKEKFNPYMAMFGPEFVNLATKILLLHLPSIKQNRIEKIWQCHIKFNVFNGNFWFNGSSHNLVTSCIFLLLKSPLSFSAHCHHHKKTILIFTFKMLFLIIKSNNFFCNM